MEIKNLDELKELIELVKKEELKEPDHMKNYLALMWYYIGKGEKVNAIRVVRYNTEMDLKESKIHVEHMMELINHYDFVNKNRCFEGG